MQWETASEEEWCSWDRNEPKNISQQAVWKEQKQIKHHKVQHTVQESTVVQRPRQVCELFGT
jgi:hypothetical protein